MRDKNKLIVPQQLVIHRASCIAIKYVLCVNDNSSKQTACLLKSISIKSNYHRKIYNGQVSIRINIKSTGNLTAYNIIAGTVTAKERKCFFIGLMYALSVSVLWEYFVYDLYCSVLYLYSASLSTSLSNHLYGPGIHHAASAMVTRHHISMQFHQQFHLRFRVDGFE